MVFWFSDVVKKEKMLESTSLHFQLGNPPGSAEGLQSLTLSGMVDHHPGQVKRVGNPGFLLGSIPMKIVAVMYAAQPRQSKEWL